jgi:hypothetical protein
VSIIRVVNTRTSDVVLKLYRRAFDALPSGGRIIIAENGLGPDRGRYGRQTGRLAITYMLSSMGDMRHIDEYAALLKEAGFQAPDVMAVEDPVVVLSATKP